MKNLMTKTLKTLAVAGMTMGLALGAKAETVTESVACTNCLTFSADKAFGLTAKKDMYYGYPNPFPTIQYSTDQKTWITFGSNTVAKAGPVGSEYKLYLRGSGNDHLSDENGKFSLTNSTDSAAEEIACTGDIETLLDYETVANGGHPEMGDYAYQSLFSGFSALAPVVLLPATNLTKYCYNAMFCYTRLRVAPELPAMNLAEGCYNNMFGSCMLLTKPPRLPATTLKKACYEGMFQECGASLTEAPELPAENLAEACYQTMFQYTGLTNAPALPATTLASTCYSCMFRGCTSLKEAPKLSATSLTKSCYFSMFQGCTALKTIPALSAKGLDERCYKSMFQGCTALKTIPALNVSLVTNNCCESMFADCSSLVVNTEGPGVEWKIPKDVEVRVRPPISAKYNFAWDTNMFANTSGTITNSYAIEPGKAYYVASAPVTLNVTAVDNATFQAYTNDAPIAGTSPYTVDYIVPVKVVYTATPGYAFPDGTTELTTNVTERAETVTVTLPKDQWPKPLPPVKFEVSAPEGATAAVYTNDVLVTGDTVLSNSIASVVYTVSEEGKYFENGQTVVTNRLGTATDPATDAAAPTKIGTPKVMLGVVAQRYPWNGTIDIQYKTPFYGANGLVTFKASGTVLGTAPGTGGQSATASFDLNTAAGGAFKDKTLKSVKITATIAP